VLLCKYDTPQGWLTGTPQWDIGQAIADSATLLAEAVFSHARIARRFKTRQGDSQAERTLIVRVGLDIPDAGWWLSRRKPRKVPWDYPTCPCQASLPKYRV
jgi:hypothetical protein